MKLLKKAFVSTIVFCLLSMSLPISAVPLDYRQLSDGEFAVNELYQDNLLSLTSDWSFSSTEASFDKDWKKDDFGDYVTGRRVLSNTDTSYSLKFDAEYEDRVGNYDESLVTQNNDRTSGEKIPDNWKSNTGYKTPSDFHVSLSRTYALQKDFDVNKYGCPKDSLGKPVSHCEVVETWFATNAILNVDLEAVGDLTDSVFGDENVTIQARADRVTRLKVNDFTLATLAEIDSTRSDFKLIEGSDFSGSVTYTGTAGIDKNGVKASVSFSPSITWDPKSGDEQAQTNLSYTKLAAMDRYENAGLANSYKVEIVDTPDVLATISGTNFTAASVFTEIGLSQVEESHRVIAAPVYGARTRQTLISDVNRQLRIPYDNFTTDLVLPFSTFVHNSSDIEVTLNSIGLNIFDEDNFKYDGIFGLLSLDDTLYDDFLGISNISLLPNEFFYLNFDITISSALLREANDRLLIFGDEGRYLELAGTADFTFTDIYGTRTRSIDIAFVPEPSASLLLIAGMIMLVSLRRLSQKGLVKGVPKRIAILSFWHSESKSKFQ
jgi:hypothetical protein